MEATTPEIVGEFQRFQTLRNNSQQNVTTRNNMQQVCKQTKHVTSNIVAPFARGFMFLFTFFHCRSFSPWWPLAFLIFSLLLS